MIRNVVMGRIGDAEDAREQVEQGIAGILSLKLPGLFANSGGLDAGLRDGGWDFAITNDWADEQAYRNYDADAVHATFRQQIAASCSELARVQFSIPD